VWGAKMMITVAVHDRMRLFVIQRLRRRFVGLRKEQAVGLGAEMPTPKRATHWRPPAQWKTDYLPSAAELLKRHGSICQGIFVG
jgi:hypothetical protein